MSIVVFLGPSLPPDRARRRLDADYRPPAAYGDLYRAATTVPRPEVIALIDGRFESVPAVRHREILWALGEGIPVVGAASIGALRACELAPFGMAGFGAVFRAYRDGLIEGDDEVALVHGPAEAGYPALSVPLVNVRATLERARKVGLVDGEDADRLLGLARRIFYKERTYGRLLAAARAVGLDGHRLDQLAAWGEFGAIDPKREDAEGLLEALAVDPAAAAPAPTVRFHLYPVDTWETDRVEMAAAPSGGDEPGLLLRAVLDELGLLPGAARAIRDAALRLALAAREAERGGGAAVGPDAAEKGLREAMGIGNTRALCRWQATNDLDDNGYRDLVRRHAEAGAVAERMSGQADARLADALRLAGRYAELAGRARKKLIALEALDRAGADGAAAFDTSARPPRFRLLQWYFAERLGRPVPDDVEAYAREQGFVDAEGFAYVLYREYLFLTRHGGGSGGQSW